jgi:hypothetical protein
MIHFFHDSIPSMILSMIPPVAHSGIIFLSRLSNVATLV